MMSVPQRVARFIDAHRLLEPEAHVLVALSGGRDSVALLALLVELGWRVSAHHVRHGLRDDAGDEKVCRGLCEALGVPLSVTRFEPGAIAGRPGAGVQDQARGARYAALVARCAELEADVLATAHHGDDVLETALLRMTRGAGVEGVGGLRSSRVIEGVRCVRPLVVLNRAEITAWVEAEGLAYVEDPSNAKSVYMRNALRLEILPRMEALWGTGRIEAMRRSARLLGRDAEALEVLVEEVLDRDAHMTEEPACYVPMHRVRRWGGAVMAQLVRHACRRVVPGHVPTALVIEEVLMRLEAPERGLWRDGAVEVGRDGAYVVVRSGEAASPEVPEALEVRGGETCFGDWRWVVEMEGEASPSELRWVPARESTGWGKRLRAVLRERGVPRPFRPGFPVLEGDEGMLWVVGERRGAREVFTRWGLRVELMRVPWYLG